MQHVRRRRTFRNPPLATLAERLPELKQLRDRLVAKIVDCDDLPAEYVRLLYNLPAEQKLWSRTDALRQGND